MSEPFVYRQGWNDERKLLKKLSEIMKEARYIQKRGKNSFHKYSYVTEADVNEKIGEMLSERGIVFIPDLTESHMRETTTARGNTEYIVKAKMSFTFMDSETGESITTKMEGEGQDNGDKAIFKAISGTQKYVLLKFFMLASGDDPEADGGVDERNEPPLNGLSAKSIGAVKAAWLKAGQKAETLNAQLQKLYARPLMELNEEQAAEFLAKLTAPKETKPNE